MSPRTGAGVRFFRSLPQRMTSGSSLCRHLSCLVRTSRPREWPAKKMPAWPRSKPGGAVTRSAEANLHRLSAHHRLRRSAGPNHGIDVTSRLPDTAGGVRQEHDGQIGVRVVAQKATRSRIQAVLLEEPGPVVRVGDELEAEPLPAGASLRGRVEGVRPLELPGEPRREQPAGPGRPHESVVPAG
jgi:hypothetical protein